MAIDIERLRTWAQSVVDQLPPESESYDRAETALWLIGFGEEAALMAATVVDDWQRRS